MIRSLFAYLAAPLPAALFQSLMVALWPKTGGAAIHAHPLSMFVAVCLAFYLLGAFLAVPLVIGLRRFWPDRRAYRRAGLIAGLVPAIALSARLVPNGFISLFASLYVLLFFGLGGYLAGALYWRIAGRPKADRDSLSRTFA